jgi:hypothetical protein
MTDHASTDTRQRAEPAQHIVLDSRARLACHRREYAAGQVMSEFVLISACVLAALLVPWMDGRSPVTLLIAAVIEFINAFAFWMAFI